MKHLREFNESYLEHGVAALKIGVQLQLLAGIAVVHAVYPDLFKDTVSTKVEELNESLEARRKPWDTCF